MGFWQNRRASGDSPASGDRHDAYEPDADPAPWVEAWQAGSQRARRRSAEVRADIAYGNRESERLDLYLPNHHPRNLPFAAFVHATGWRPPVKTDSGFPAKAIHRHGAAFIAVGFDGLPVAGLDTQADQVCRAWRFLVDNAAHFGLDPARGHLLGHSTGAHLAALAAFDPLGPPPVSAVLLSGIYDLEPVRRSVRNEALGLDDEAVARLSPIRRIRRAGTGLVVAWGEREPDEMRRQSREFALACRTRGLSVVHGELPGRTHLDTSLELADPHSRTLETLYPRRG